jgi:D-xylose transport system substrate-binding protein
MVRTSVFKRLTAVAVMGLVAATAAACGSDDSSTAGGDGGSGGGTDVGVILPDATTSPRWEANDAPSLQAAFDAAGVSSDIQNAQGDVNKFGQLCDQMIGEGVKVLLIVNIDQESGKACLDKATAAGVQSIDYDRLTPGGGAALYVSFDNVKVGEVQGKTLTQCPQVKGQKSVKYVEIDGAPTDNNATLFKQGYNGVLSKQSGWTKVAEQTGNWDAPTAGRVFSSMLGKNPDLKAVMVANDTMAGAVVTDLKRQSLNGKVAVSGQDATAEGLQHIMDGDQCFTVYKPSTAEAEPAIKAIAQLANGQVPDTKGVTVEDPQTHKKVPAILATPVAITKANVATPINDKYTPKNTVCTGAYADKCKAAGVN